MKGYRKISGVYVELSDNIPVSLTFTPVAIRPSVLHTFATEWQNDPLTEEVCWRLKTVSELQAEKDSSLQEFFDSPTGRALKTLVQTGVEKGFWTLGELRAKYRAL